MLSKGPAKKVTIFVNEDARHHHLPLHDAILEFLLHRGVSGATATRALAGFGSHRVLHTPHIEVLAEHLPIRIEFIESAAKVEEILPTLYDMVADGLMEVQDTTVVRHAGPAAKSEPPRRHERREGQARMMRVFLGEADKWHGVPLYEAIVKRLMAMDIAGATVYRGILGYGVKRHTHASGFLHLSHDLPMMIAVIDTAEKLEAGAGAIEEMMTDGLIVFSEVEMVRLIHAEGGDAGTAS